jgi:hypothetical protein
MKASSRPEPLYTLAIPTSDIRSSLFHMHRPIKPRLNAKRSASINLYVLRLARTEPFSHDFLRPFSTVPANFDGWREPLQDRIRERTPPTSQLRLLRM